MRKKQRKDGWQVWVDFRPKHVMKKHKTKDEIRKRISPHLKRTKRINELEERVESMLNNIEESTKIIKNSKVPRYIIGHPIFLKGGIIKQKRVIPLEDYLVNLSKKGDIVEAKKVVDKTIKTILKLWQYGIHEKTFKFHMNFGIHNSKIILIDFLEITDKKTKVEKQLRKKPWRKIKEYEKIISEEILDYWIEQADKNLTIKELNKNWRIK